MSIQMSMVPTLPAFPDIESLDVHALLRPAREVGGDLFDFFPLSENRVCFLIGDVSGKGVPAALVMAVALTLVRTIARTARDPAEVLQ